MTSQDELQVIQEDDSDAWWYQLDLEARQAQEREPTPDVRQVIENLDRSIALLRHIQPTEKYAVVADLCQKLVAERTFLERRQEILLNELVKTARNLLIK